MYQLNKLQIKAEILTVLSQMQANLESTNVEELLANLEKQEDKKTILDVLVKELTKANEQKAILITFMLLKLCDKTLIEDSLWGVLKSSTVNDSVKAIILNVLKDMGNKVDYNQLEEFFEDPNEVIDADTKKLLQTAIINPEAQIDFLDFLHSLSEEDRVVLVQSLGEDYSSDSLANILNPLVLYMPTSRLGHIAIDILGTTKSQLAFHALNEALKFVDDEETVLLINRNISKLKIAGVREDNAIEFYKSVLMSKPYFSYVSFPDGHGNQAVIFSREKADESIQFISVVLNDMYGLVDCFGFNEITKPEFERIVDKFYGNDDHIYISPSVIKNILIDAEKLTRKNGGKISYEYLCWKNLMADIQVNPVPIELILKTQYKNQVLSEREFNNICMMDIVQKWFFDVEENEEFAGLIKSLNVEFGENRFDIDLENVVKDNFEKIFSSLQKSLLDNRILMSAYLKFLSEGRPNAHEEAQLLYSLYFDENQKAQLAENIIRKSIYEYYVTLKFKSKEENKMTNIFVMRNKHKTTTLTSKQIDAAISIIENFWVQE